MLNLLIADDEKLIREPLANCLDWEEIGIRVVGCCADGLEALDCIMDELPDIVMTDIKMPGLNGLELIAKMQEIDREIEFIILSGYREFDFAQKAMELGVRRYLLKPVSEEQVLEAVLDAIASCRQRRARQNSLPHPSRLSQEALRQLPGQLLDLAETGGREELEARIRGHFTGAEELQALRGASANLIEGILTQRQPLHLARETFQGVFDEIYRESDPAALVDRVVETAVSLLQRDTGGNDLVQKVKRYVGSNLADSTLSLKRIAAQYAHANPDYLSHLFVQETGEKFSHYLNRKRVEKAKQLLQEDSSKVYQVAEQVGLGHNPRYFGQVFKKYTGIPPSAYAEAQENRGKRP